ncbi:MAG: formate/nitrite transporter family protein [Gammaproteobacteria bacterium]|nr:formate/nitrite transporter family protein [Gammaproteobacteria bacterium]
MAKRQQAKPGQDTVEAQAEAVAEKEYLEGHEQRDAAVRAAPRAAIVYEAVRLEGDEELARPVAALFWSGLAAGLSMGFSFITKSLMAYWLPDAAWTPVITGLGYSVGFLIVILGRQQLFTENTLTPILVVLRRWTVETVGRTLRLWVIVLVANTIGAFLFALLIAETPLFNQNVHDSLAIVSIHAFGDFSAVLLRGIFAGWLIAMIIWLLPFAETARVAVIVLLTYVISLGHFPHIIAGAIGAFYAALVGHVGWGAVFMNFYIPALLGNVIGGVSLVALVNYAQVENLASRR